MKKIDNSKPVMVTGATGYVASWLVKKLLDEGLTVHAPVRDPLNEDKLKHLRDIAAVSKGKIKFFKADLLDEGSYDEAIKGCELVFHTASPFINTVRDPQKDLVDPALKGTRNVLESVNRTDSVKRVVLTSSVAAILGDLKDLENIPLRVATEDHWNNTSTLKHQPYSYSKTVAEREAWSINKLQERWDLVVINPALVVGPGLNPKATSESFNLFAQIGDGRMKFGVPEINIDIIDVRDLAEAHYRAGFTPQAEGRHIIAGRSTSMFGMAEILKKKYGKDFVFPERVLPKFIVWLMAPAAGYTRKVMSNNVGYPFIVDNSKAVKELGMRYRELDESVIEFFQQLVDSGFIKSKKNLRETA